jgi:hypothetical protein
MGVALRDLRGKVKRPIRSVSLCIDGELWARHDELTAKLNKVTASEGSTKMGQSSEARAVAQELAAVEAEMREAQVTVQLRGISSYKLAEIQARFPTESGRGWDINAGAAALVAACAVEPTTEEEARELLEELSYAASDKLVAAAWEATTGSSEVPTSARASALINASA